MSVPPHSGRRLSAQSPPCAAYANYPTREELTLTAETSDPDSDDTVSVAWTVDGLSVKSTWTPPGDGTYTIVATCDDGNGRTTTDSVTITVGEVTEPWPVAHDR